MPIFHGNALMAALGPCLANGSAFAMRRRFSASGFLPDIRRFGASLPETATHKVSKPALRRLLWQGEDPVYERDGESYVLMTADRKSALAAEYAGHGREHLLGL
jgi:fatty-acyl-CoA synthase